jgi:hypothetical protein
MVRNYIANKLNLSFTIARRKQSMEKRRMPAIEKRRKPTVTPLRSILFRAKA